MLLRSYLLCGLATVALLPVSAAAQTSPRRPAAAREAAAPAEAFVIRSPQQAVDLALARAPVLRSAAAGIRGAQGDRLQAGLRPNPEFSFSAENFGGTRAYGGIRSLETTYGLSQRLEVGGQRQARIAAANDALSLTGLDAQAVRLDLVREVLRALAMAVAAARNIEIGRERMRLSQEVVRATQARVDAGREPFVQQRRAEVAQETAAVALERAQRDAEVAAQALATLLAAGRVDVAAARADWFDDLGPQPAAARQVPAAPAQQLDRARLDALIAQRRSELEVQRRTAVPDVSVNAGVRRYREAGGDTSFVLGLSVPLPVFDRNQGNIMRAGADLARAEAEAERGRLYLDSSMVEAERRLDQAWRAANSLRRTVLPAAIEAAGFARSGYADGKFSLLEVLDAQRVLSDVREQLNAARLEVQQVRADIGRLRGQAEIPDTSTAPRGTRRP
ncbi:TolC family protein [Roseococcus pinisoli]|uniref:TolC family protein n=1 Tax=Roseococcus pinisoli TaxID=2835040 RepID=A0ABS5QIZ6_9PROT|nr:TolC family protein [Roseococcus pinisoli]MBS7813621.1 TolC family protein [Roseococcus pinisoli]